MSADQEFSNSGFFAEYSSVSFDLEENIKNKIYESGLLTFPKVRSVIIDTS